MKRHLLLLALMIISITVSATPVDPARAMQIAQEFVPKQHPSAHGQHSPAAQMGEIVYTHCMPQSGKPAIYVVNVGNAFALVSAEDVAHPILGYNYSKSWPTDGNLPPQVKSFLDDLAQQMETAAEHPQDAETAEEWLNPRKAPKRSATNDNLPDSVGPLLTTTWDQGQYYNSLCPEDGQSMYDGHCPTGCVATAMAQIINYWGQRDTIHPRGTHSYQSNYGELTVNYATTSCDFAHMPNALSAQSTQQEIDAVAKLMYDCGVAVNMDYNPNQGAAKNENVRTALINNYGFSLSLGLADRHMYSEEEWETLLRREIALGRPVFYIGYNYLVGHAFVLDGYNGNCHFHFNFGWSGDYDGWYLTSAINPSWEFNSWQQAIIGICPDTLNEVNVLCNFAPVFDYSSETYKPVQEYYTVSEPVHLCNMFANNAYLMNYDNYGSIKPILLHFSPINSDEQLVLDIIRMDVNHAVIVYDGDKMDSLICVLEPFGEGWPYAQLPNNPEYQQSVTNDFSPIVSSKHGFTIMAYCSGMIPEEFHMLVSNASSCRMVSNIESIRESSDYKLSWLSHDSASQWQVAWNDSLVLCDTTSITIKDMAYNANCDIAIRSVCGDDTYSRWNTIRLNEKKYWPDFVENEPEGFSMNGNTVTISSAEGLAWWIRQCQDLYYPTEQNSKTIEIVEDIDLDAHLWKAIWYYGKVNGNGHTISNVKTSYAYGGNGFFMNYEGDTISDFHLKTARIGGFNGVGSLAAGINHATIINCSSENYRVSSRGGTVGGLIGVALYSEILNCYALGDNYCASINGGIVGYNYNTELTNCYSSIGTSFQWQDCNAIFNGAGLLSGADEGGVYDNCFADISKAQRQWHTDVDSMATLYYFFGYASGHGIQIESATNVAAFRVVGDSIGQIIHDTVVHYFLPEDINLLSALNRKVVEKNAYGLRKWVWDNTLHFPSLGNYYKPSCPNVSNIEIKNIKYNDGFAVALSWQENGDATKWQVKYTTDDVAESHITDATFDTIVGLTLGKDYNFYLRPICGEGDTVGWSQPIKLHVDMIYWDDVVTSQPEGFVIDSEGNVDISSAEGLAWLMHTPYGGKTVSILNDIDMGAYRWKPINCYSLCTIEGNNHTISNIICRESVSDENATNIGFVGQLSDAMIRDLNIKDGVFIGRVNVGGIFGFATSGIVDNCHVVNGKISGRSSAGGLGGLVGNGDIALSVRNSSASGIIYADKSVGGLIGSVQSKIAAIDNCYASCNISSIEKSPLLERGGLVGGNQGVFSNCYSAGEIKYDKNTYYNYAGLSIGNIGINGEMHNVYALQYDTLPFEGRDDAWLEYHYVLIDTALFDNTGTLHSTVTIEGIPYTDLLSALNAWVDVNNSEGIYRHWVADTENINGGFPIFVPNDNPTSIDLPIDKNQSSKATKILRDGQILILRGDKTYTLTGQEIIIP